MVELAGNLVIGKLMPFLSEETNLLLSINEVVEIKDELEYIRAFLKDADAVSHGTSRERRQKQCHKTLGERCEGSS